jgi:hypothetical protein
LSLAALTLAALGDVQAANPNATLLDDDNAHQTFTAVNSTRSGMGGGTFMMTAAGAWTGSM